MKKEWAYLHIILSTLIVSVPYAKAARIGITAIADSYVEAAAPTGTMAVRACCMPTTTAGNSSIQPSLTKGISG